MWTLLGSRAAYCDRTRRNLMQVGLFSAAGLTLTDLLRANPASAKAGTAQPRSAIHIFLAGGPSHYETFDPKPDAPIEIRGPYNPISTNVPGINICETLPALAKIADKYSLIRSCCHDNTGHGGGQRYVTTGYKSASLEDELPHDYPHVGSWVSKARGGMQNGMPTYLQLGGSGEKHPAFLGPACAPFSVYSTGKPVGLELNPMVKVERLENRRQLLKQLDTLRRHAESGQQMDALDTLEQQAYEMLTSTAAREAFELSKEPAEMRERYGNHDSGRCCLLARRFIEAGAGFVSIRMGSWDHHGNAGGTITSGMDEHGPPMDQAVSTLISDLHDRGLSEQVLVLVWGEFGRTPRINSFFGRDHWPGAMSVLVAGGGLNMGQVIGATSHKGEHPIDRALSPADVLATVYRQLGVDTTRVYHNSAGRPVPILSHGEPITELL